jgi:hypothetical protein
VLVFGVLFLCAAIVTTGLCLVLKPWNRATSAEPAVEFTVGALSTENAILATRVAALEEPAAQPTSTAPPEITATISPTQAPSMTAPPAPTDTPSPKPSSTPEPSPPSTPLAQIVSFSASPSPADPAGTLTLSWNARGASSVSLSWLDKQNETVNRSGLPLSGSLPVALVDVKFTSGDRVDFTLSANDARGQPVVDQDGEFIAKRISVPLKTDLTIVSFSASPDPLERGGTVTLSWNAPGAMSVGITRLSPDGDIFLVTEASNLPASGSLALPVPEEYTDYVSYYLGARDAKQVLRGAYATARILCPFDDHLAPECPLTHDYVWAAYQPFERGQMVWREDSREIYVLVDPEGSANDGNYATFEDTWKEGDPVNLPGTPPAGLYAPVRGFGNLWANQPQVRAKLGWATAEEAGYTMLVETIRGGSGRYPAKSSYFTLPDGRVVILYPFSSSWQVVP